MIKDKHRLPICCVGLVFLFAACAPKAVPDTLGPPPQVEKEQAGKPAQAPKAKADKPKEEPKAAPKKAPEPKEQAKPLEPEPTAEMDDQDNYIVLNFEDADLEMVLQTVSELIGMNYILGPKVKGRITIQTYKKIPREDLPAVLNSILAINGFSTVQSGHYTKIVPTPEAKQHPIETVVGREAELEDQDVMVTQIFPLEQISAQELSSIIKPLISKGGDIIVHKDTNLLILNEVASNLKRIHKIIDLVDVPTESTSGEKIFVYYVENADASKLASTLNAIYKKQGRDKKPKPLSAAAKALERAKRAVRKRTRKPKTPKAPAPASLESDLEGEVTIVADTEINALIIKTTPRDYKKMRELLDKLDILPQQVLVEVLIANVTLDKSTKFGLEWAAGGGSQLAGYASDGINLTPATELGAGFTYLVQKTNRLKTILSMSASKGNLNILSSPHLLTADNKEASINIVDQEPIAKITYTGTSTNIPNYSYEYKDVGIKLTVTPNINDKGLVAMKVGLEVSEVSGTSDLGEAGTASRFTKREIKTSLVVQTAQSLVIGGLIKEKRDVQRSGIPWLMDIPYLGYLFGTTSETIVKNELVLLITPRVISTLKEARDLTDRYEREMEKLKDIIEQK